MKITDNRRIARKALQITLIVAFALLIMLCVFIHSPSAVYAATEDGSTYTTTDKLYLQIPDANKTMTFTTAGGTEGMNGDVISAKSISSTIKVRQWFDVYIAPVNPNRDYWNVAKSDAVDGKWYFDPAKYPLRKRAANTYKLVLETREMPESNSMYTFLCMGNETLWEAVGTSAFDFTPPKQVTCDKSRPKISLTGGSTINPFEDSRIADIGNPLDGMGGMLLVIQNHNMAIKPLGINPVAKTKQLWTIMPDSGKLKLSFDYYIGAMRLPSHCESTLYDTAMAAQVNRAPCQRDSFYIEIDTKSDSTAPNLIVSSAISQSSVSASWTDNSYSYATYTHNGISQGEYTKNELLKSEGKYVITATDCVGNSSSETVYVDRTAPKFSSEFYDAAGTPLTLISKTRARASWLSAGTNESPIKSCTYVREFYDAATNSIKSDAAKTYTKGAELTAEGKYTFTLTDSAGNSSTATYIVDKTAPTITANNEASKTSVSASTAYSTVETSISMTYSLNGGATTVYRSGQSLSSEGKYIITATDAAGNSSTKTLYVDKTVPTLTYTETSKSAVSASWSVGTNESPVTATYVHTSIGGTSARTAYRSGQSLTAEGKYVITATDAAGNSSIATLYVDKTAPSVTVSDPSKTSVRASFSTAAHESPVTATVQHNGDTAVTYSSGRALTDPGRYIFTVTDRAGNSTTKTTYVDNAAPALTRSFEYGNTDGAVTFAHSDYESHVSAVYSFVGASGTETNIAYTSGQALSADGEYTVTATDAAGNVATIKLVVDRKAPSLIFADGTTGALQTTRGSSSVTWTVERHESPVNVEYSFSSFDEGKAPSANNVPYTSGALFTAEGTYEFTATDAAGNTAAATVIIDNTPPTLTFAANGITFEQYTNSVFTARGDDALSGVDKIEIYENGKYIQYDFMPRSDNGAYLFRLSDKAGNMTSATVTVYSTDTFGNLASIRDGYKTNSWYVVTLPARIFTTDSRDVAGRYSFDSYESALEFAERNEREFRVSTVQGGFMYVSATNESVAQKYEDKTALNTVIEKYAKGYISARQTATVNGNDKYYTEPESLTRNSLILPDYLLELKDLPRYYIRPGTVWSLPNLSFISGMPYTVTAEYLGDFAAESGKTFTVKSGSTFITALGGEYKQGYYLITESDEAGNVERYLVYSDAELPSARVAATSGDGEKDFVLDYTYTRNETLYFISLAFEGITDNTDAFVTLKIEKGNSVKYFVQSDELPTLGSDDYTSGKYTVTIFDRSLNALIFDVFIAGSAPTMTHGSLAADKPDCKISFVTSDRYNVITGITLYKIEYDGTKTVLDTDGAGVPITAATLSYTLTVGGKYGATVTDNYRRTVELLPIFFLKGLPSGKLSGVADGGRTNNNVSFTFDSGDVAELFVLLPDGERQSFTDFTVQTGSADKTYNITANELTSHEYLVFLHNAQDLSLFVEYTFEIDTILPEFEITDSDGNVIQPDGATNKSFSISWSETGVNMRYYTAKGGQLSAAKYNMNAVLSQGTLYYFTLKDDVGNTLDFTVLLDNAVDYTLNGKYNEVNGVMYAAAPITFTVNEPTQEFSVVNADGYTIDNGGTLTQGGRYDITVTDNYRNTVTLVLVLDFAPPTISLVGAENGAAVKSDVAVSAFDYDYLYLSDAKGNKLKDIENGEIFSAAGVYYITARDYAGNTVTVSFSIDLSVDYTLSVPSGAVTTEKVTLDTAEQLDIAVKLNGLAIDSATKFTDYGEYELTLTDALGNSVSCVFTIISSKSQTLNVPLPNGTRIVRVLRNGEPFELTDRSALAFDTTGVYVVTLDCGGTPFELTVETDNTPPVVMLNNDGKTVGIAAVDKENVELKLTLDGEEINCRVGQTLDEPGHYVLTATDALGNVAVYKFDIPFRLNTWAIVAIAVGAVVLIVVIVLIIRARRKPRLK